MGNKWVTFCVQAEHFYLSPKNVTHATHVQFRNSAVQAGLQAFRSVTCLKLTT